MGGGRGGCTTFVVCRMVWWVVGVVWCMYVDMYISGIYGAIRDGYLAPAKSKKEGVVSKGRLRRDVRGAGTWEFPASLGKFYMGAMYLPTYQTFRKWKALEKESHLAWMKRPASSPSGREIKAPGEAGKGGRARKRKL